MNLFIISGTVSKDDFDTNTTSAGTTLHVTHILRNNKCSRSEITKQFAMLYSA